MTANTKITPMMAQFLDIKSGYPDALLFYRMGDFYELFFADAEAASAALDIALTKRGKHQGKDIPMCGVPAHSAENYLLTLIRKGFRVAVCEQVEDVAEAKKRGAKSVVRREVVRLVTPGTLTEDSLLDTRRNNYLAAWSEIRGEGAISWADMSTGALTVTRCSRVSLGPMLARLTPSEILVPENLHSELDVLIIESGGVSTPLSRASFDSTMGEQRISNVYAVDSLDGFAAFDRVEISALGAIIDYLEVTQKGKLPLLGRPVREAEGGQMRIDSATRRNLELTRGASGGREGSLLSAIDRTVTGAGARLLEARINAPTMNVRLIHERHHALRKFTEEPGLTEDIRTRLRRTPDLERALSRISLDRGGPRDLAAIRDGLAQASGIAGCLEGDQPEIIVEARTAMTGQEDLIDMLDGALVAEPPLFARDGGYIAPGYDAELDETRRLRDEGRGIVAGLQKEYISDTGINSLKIKHNNVLGYFIETPAAHARKMLSEPMSEQFKHRQTTANAVRFTTQELAETESKILNAGTHALEIEKGIFERLQNMILDAAGATGAAAKALAEVDLCCALADLATGEAWVCPVIDDSRCFTIKGGRHPVVEQALRRSGDGFVANDCDLSAGFDDARPVWLITGPNMAGKSTFLRQNALIAVLAQIGSYVPAAEAHIGVVDQLFSRVGAADDLARGRSTFMVEMVETAAILNQSGERALVILDEIGRGTATYDGLSIAWAVLEHLHDSNKCRALFATHYHELTALSTRLPGLRNATVAVREWQGEVIFLHEVREGAADRSYGVQVAQLAGLPFAVVERARVVLDALEKGERSQGGKAKALVDDLPLFSIAPPTRPENKTPSQPSKLEERVKSVSPDELSPREALSLLYELRGMVETGQTAYSDLKSD